MSSQKRTHEEVDPDYADVSEQQAKRQRALEQDAKQAVEKRIQTIVKSEFQKEISNKETELHQIDRRLNEARLMMDRLRACIVANYYGQMNQPTSSQVSTINAPPPSIHPAVKKHLGKKPAHTISDSTSSQCQSETDKTRDILQSNKQSGSVSDSTHNHLRTNNSLQEVKKINNSSSISVTSLLSSLSGSRGDTPSVKVPQAITSDAATYDDRRSRFKIKKKIIVGNVSKYIPVDHRESNDMSSHKWMVYVRGPKSDPDISCFVKKVWFFLHHSYKPNDLVEISSPPFHLTRRGWGEFPVRVQLHFLDPRSKKVDIIHHLKLDKTFTGLQTLGAETVVEVELERDFFESGGSNTASLQPSSSWPPSIEQHRKSLLSTPSRSSPSVSKSDMKKSNENSSSGISDSSNSSLHRHRDSNSLTSALSEPKRLPAGMGSTALQKEVSTETISINSPVEKQLESSEMVEPDSENIMINQGSPGSVDITTLEEYNVTIAHDTGDKGFDEEMVVDVCEGGGDVEQSKGVTFSQNTTDTLTGGVVSTPTVISSEASDATRTEKSSSQTVSLISSHLPDSAPSSSKELYQCLTIIKDPSQIRHSNSQNIGENRALLSQSVTAPKSVLPQNTLLLASNNETAQIVKPVQPVSTVINTNTGVESLQHTIKLSTTTTESISKSSLIHTARSTSLLKQAAIGKPSSPSTTRVTMNSANLQSLLPQSVVISSMPQFNKVNPDSAISQSSLSSPHSTSVVCASNQLHSTKPHTNVSSLLSTQQTDNQTSIRPPAFQKMIILRPGSPSLVTNKAVPSFIVPNLVSTDSKMAADHQKSVVPRQVSLLTGQVVRQQTPARSVHQTTPTHQKSTSLLSGSQAVSGQVPSQTILFSKFPNQTKATNSKVTNQVILLNNAKQPQRVSMISQSPNLATTNQITDVNGHVVVNQKSQPVAVSLLNSGVVKQASLLSNLTGPKKSTIPQSQIPLTGANNSSLILHLPGNSQHSSNQNPYSKMSAIGITKHGKGYSRNQTVPDNRISTDEERKKSQYDILRAWKENPDLYSRNSMKAKKTVLAAKDRIEGEVDVILPLNIEDYTRLEPLMKAAVKLHPLIQAGVNKLTHPYCAESLDQWNSWPVGKQRASEWHRACFVLKYLRICLGKNRADFKGEPLMTTRQLVSWCRLHAFSPCVSVENHKPEEEKLHPLSLLHNHSHHPSFTPTVDVESELATQTTLNNDGVGMEVEVLNDEPVSDHGTCKVKQKETEKKKDSVNPIWLPPSDGAVFVYDELRKRGIKMQPVELEPGVMACTAAEIVFQAMQEFSADILREALAVSIRSQSSTSDGLKRQDVHKAITNLPEAVFCCDKFLGKEEEGQEEGVR